MASRLANTRRIEDEGNRQTEADKPLTGWSFTPRDHGTKQMMAATEPDGMQAIQQMLTAMLQLQMDNDRRRDEQEECDREERRLTREEERQMRREKADREAAEKEAWERSQAKLEGRRRELEEEAAEKRAASEKAKQVAEATRKRNNRLLRTLRPMGEREDLEVYLTGFEHTLQQCQVEEADWLPYLCAYLTGKNLALVQGLTIDRTKVTIPSKDDYWRQRASPLRMRERSF